MIIHFFLCLFINYKSAILIIGGMMKKNKKNNGLKFIIFIILASIITYCFLNKDVEEVKEPEENIVENITDDEKLPEVEEKTTYLNEITYTSNIDKEIENKIVEYMDLYYKQMKELKEYDMTYLFSDNEQAYINQTAVSLLVEIRKLKPNDLTLYSASYDLDVKEVVETGNTVEVTVRENNYLRFNFMKNTESKVYNIKNIFTLKKVNGEYKISKYDKVQDFFVMVTDKYSYTSNYENSLDKIKNDYLKIIKSNEKDLEKNYDEFINNGITNKECDHGYDRDKSLEYALKWVNKRNDEWTTFGANCQNFASQVLSTGGIPMDHTGSSDDFMQWKFYDSSYNESEVSKGYVYTWTSVPRFGYYIKNNVGSGICAVFDENLYFAEAGDIIHVGTSGANRHALVSIGTYKVDGKVVDVLVNSNTVDLENFPMSAYVYPYTSLIKVYGWNE